ncbi:MAG: hypothetical protein Q6373_007225, partial [Candidatus Sigynarchaeota archaeon]
MLTMATNTPSALLLRVGADTGSRSGGYRGHIDSNASFIWTPIPTHNDPDFERKTYGDTKRGKLFKITQLQKLKPGDWLVFYAGLLHIPSGIPGAYIVGYFIVRKVMDFISKQYNSDQIGQMKMEINKHQEEAFDEKPDSAIIIFGEKGRGGLLEHAIKIGSFKAGRYKADDIIKDKIKRGDD